MTFIDLIPGMVIKRGDLVQSNIGDPRERTWLVLRARRRLRAKTKYWRYDLWMVRWWELEPEMRMRLFQSAERNGGQTTWPFYRYPAKKKPHSFEQWMRRAR